MIVNVINEATQQVSEGTQQVNEGVNIAGFSSFTIDDRAAYGTKDFVEFPEGNAPLINHVLETDNLVVDVIVSGSGDADFPYFIAMWVDAESNSFVGTAYTEDLDSAKELATKLSKEAATAAKNPKVTYKAFDRIANKLDLEIFN